MSCLSDFRRMVHDPAMKRLEEIARERDSLREALKTLEDKTSPSGCWADRHVYDYVKRILSATEGRKS